MPRQDFVSVSCQVVQQGAKVKNLHIAEGNHKKNYRG
jgi:hypothetical protein